MNTGRPRGELNLIYRGPEFQNVSISPVIYQPEYFQREIDLESSVFFELRSRNGIIPNRISQSSTKELKEIESYFERNQDSFYFLFSDQELIGSILCVKNNIQSLAIDPKFQNQGYGKQLAMVAINAIFERGYASVELKVMDGNTRAENFYRKIGFGPDTCQGDHWGELCR